MSFGHWRTASCTYCCLRHHHPASAPADTGAAMQKTHTPCAHSDRPCVQQPWRLKYAGQLCSSSKHTAPKRYSRSVTVQQSGNVVVTGIVAAMTKTLRAFGVGKQQYEDIMERSPHNQCLPAGDIPGVMDRITADFQQAYFVTGIINDSIYAQDCRFADPTVSFTGLDLWKRNLQLLVPFLVEPRIQLLSLKNLGYSKTGAQQLKAEWTLQTCLSLPWRPVISILGSTVYTLSREGNKVVEHVEGWNVTPVQALLAVFTPGHARS